MNKEIKFDFEYEHIHIGITPYCGKCYKCFSVDIEYLDRGRFFYDDISYLYYKAPCPFCKEKHEVLVDAELNITVRSKNKWEGDDYNYEKDDVVKE